MTTAIAAPLLSAPPAEKTSHEKQQESWVHKSQARVNPDRIISAVVALFFVVLVMGASFTFSFTAIYEAAEWTGQQQWVWVAAPIYIDGAILAYTIARTIQRWRGERGAWSLFFLLLYTGLSVVVNFAHTASYWEWDLSTPESWVGLAIAAGAPIAAVGTAEQIIHLIFKRNNVELPRRRGWLGRMFDRANAPDSDLTTADVPATVAAEAPPVVRQAPFVVDEEPRTLVVPPGLEGFHARDAAGSEAATTGPIPTVAEGLGSR